MHRWLWAGLCGGLLLLVGGGVGAVQSAHAQAASPRIEARVSVDSVKIGARFTLTLAAEHAADTEVLFPPPDAAPALFGDLRVLDRGPVQTRRPSGERPIDRVAYEVTTFALDSARVPVVPVRLVADGDTAVAGSRPRVIPVVSVVGPEADGLRTPALLAAFPRPAWLWGVLGLLTAALVAGLAYWWRRQEDNASSDGAADERPDPYTEASVRLQRLERRNPTGREACKAFYVDLTETLRVYLAQRVGVRALEQTTSEMLAALRRRPEVQEVVLRRLQTVLQQADLVKFADAEPSPSQSRGLLQDAQGVLDALEAAQRRADSQAVDGDAASA